MERQIPREPASLSGGTEAWKQADAEKTPGDKKEKNMSEKVYQDTEAENNTNEQESGEDSLAIYQSYLEEIAALSICTDEENEKLLARVRALKGGNGSDAVDRLVEGNLRRVLAFVPDYMNRGVPMLDLIQEASLALLCTAKEAPEGDFASNLEAGVRKQLEAVVKEENAEHQAEEDLTDRVNRLQETAKNLAEELGREAKPEELAGHMGLTEDDVKDTMKLAMDALRLSDLNKSLQS